VSSYRRKARPTWTVISDNGETPEQTLAHEIAHSLAAMALGADSSVIRLMRTPDGLLPRCVSRGCNLRDPLVNAALSMAAAVNVTTLPGPNGAEMLVDGPSPSDVQSVIDAGLSNPAVSAGAIRGAVFGINVAAVTSTLATQLLDASDLFKQAVVLPPGQFLEIRADEWLQSMLPLVVTTWDQTEPAAQAVGRLASITLRSGAN
jgi:hypothetical protein